MKHYQLALFNDLLSDDLKTVYCPNGFELDPIFEDHVKPYVEGTHLIQYCEVVIARTIRCKTEQTCKAFHYNMKECGYPNQDISCIKHTTGKFKVHACFKPGIGKTMLEYKSSI